MQSCMHFSLAYGDEKKAYHSFGTPYNFLMELADGFEPPTC